MNTLKRLKRKSDPLLLLVLFAGLGVFMTTLSAADDSFLSHPVINDLKDGDVMLAPIGRRGAGVHMFVTTPGESTATSFTASDSGMRQINVAESAVNLSVVIPW